MIRHALGRAVLGAAFLALSACAGAPAPSPSSAPTPRAATPASAPTRAPSASAASPEALAPGLLTPAAIDTPLGAGTHEVGAPFGAPFEITLPAAWHLADLTDADVEFVVAVGDGSPGWVVVDMVENVFEDPCRSASGPADPAVPRTVDGIVKALTAMVGYEAGPVTDVTVDGRAGKAVELVNTIDTDTTVCDGDRMLPMWTFRGGAAQTNGLAHEQIRVVDVDGVPVIIDGETFADTSQDVRDATHRIVESIRFPAR